MKNIKVTTSQGTFLLEGLERAKNFARLYNGIIVGGGANE